MYVYQTNSIQLSFYVIRKQNLGNSVCEKHHRPRDHSFIFTMCTCTQYCVSLKILLKINNPNIKKKQKNTHIIKQNLTRKQTIQQVQNLQLI